MESQSLGEGGLSIEQPAGTSAPYPERMQVFWFVCLTASSSLASLALFRVFLQHPPLAARLPLQRCESGCGQVMMGMMSHHHSSWNLLGMEEMADEHKSVLQMTQMAPVSLSLNGFFSWCSSISSTLQLVEKQA